MIKQIYKQLWVNRRSTGWLFTELFLIFCLVWYIVDFFFVVDYTYHLKNYQDTSGAWQVVMEEFEEDNDYYSVAEQEDGKRYHHFTGIINRLKNKEEIDDIALVFYNHSLPGTGSDHGISLVNVEDSTCTFAGSIIRFDPDYDYFGIFRYSRDKGRTRVHTTDFDWSLPGSIIVNRKAVKQAGGDISGKSFRNKWEQNEEYRVIGVIDESKRIKFERPRNFVYIPERLTPGLIEATKIIIRQHPSLSKSQFKAFFEREIVKDLQAGNFYFAKLVYIPQINANSEKVFGMDNRKSMHLLMMIFFLANIFLCLLGTFWYRVHTRQGEIGLRIALGSTHRSILHLFLLEVVCLVLLVLPIAFLVEWQVISLDLLDGYQKKWLDPFYLPDRLFLRFLITNGITFGLILLIAGLSVWIPAYKASRLQPADALHYE